LLPSRVVLIELKSAFAAMIDFAYDDRGEKLTKGAGETVF
jgi:hypothetical protein